MKYQFVLVPITCTSILDEENFSETYELSEVSKRELARYATVLRKCKEPSLVIFASCYSFESQIKDYLYSTGVMASLSITKDKGNITEGKEFSLDEDQQDIIKDFAEVHFL